MNRETRCAERNLKLTLPFFVWESSFTFRIFKASFRRFFSLVSCLGTKNQCSAGKTGLWNRYENKHCLNRKRVHLTVFLKDDAYGQTVIYEFVYIRTSLSVTGVLLNVKSSIQSVFNFTKKRKRLRIFLNKTARFGTTGVQFACCGADETEVNVCAILCSSSLWREPF